MTSWLGGTPSKGEKVGLVAVVLLFVIALAFIAVVVIQRSAECESVGGVWISGNCVDSDVVVELP